MNRRIHPTARGVSLLEVLVSLGVIAVLIALTLPSLSAARRKARTSVCLSNARQISTAVGTFAASNSSRLPENRTLVDASSHVTWRHRFVIEGYLAAGALWKCPDHPGEPAGELGLRDRDTVCVGDVRSSYALNGHVLWRTKTAKDAAKRSDAAIQRPSHTILVAESRAEFPDVRVMNDLLAAQDDRGGVFGFWHAGKGVYSFLDGHAETFNLLDTGSPDCRWHNGKDLSPDPDFVQPESEYAPHDHPDWRFLVSPVYVTNANKGP